MLKGNLSVTGRSTCSHLYKNNSNNQRITIILVLLGIRTAIINSKNCDNIDFNHCINSITKSAFEAAATATNYIVESLNARRRLQWREHSIP